MKINVPIIYVTPGMVTSEPLLTDVGLTICRSGRCLSETVISQIIGHGYKYIAIERSSIPEDVLNSILQTSGTISSVIQSEEFIRFETRYDAQLERAKQIIVDISKEKKIDMNEINQTINKTLECVEFRTSVFDYLNHIRVKDDYTYQHSINVSIIANVFAKWLNLNAEEILFITVAGMLHDVGKTQIDPNVLNKKGKLTDDEFALIKTHAKRGYDLIRRQNIPDRIKDAVLMHHEKIDGRGYPYGLVDLQIEPFAKIVSICDIYDAMTSNRVYRARMCPFDVIRTFERSSYGQLDTNFLLVFLRNIAYMYLGVKVLLSNNIEAEVVFINNNNLSRPIVKTIRDEVIDLSYSKELYIYSLV